MDVTAILMVAGSAGAAGMAAGFIVGGVMASAKNLDIINAALPSDEDMEWTMPPRPPSSVGRGAAIVHVSKSLKEADAAKLKSALQNSRADKSFPLVEPMLGAPQDPASIEHASLIARALRYTAQALAEIARFQHSGPHNDRFPLEEDVEVFLAKALQATINILLAYQPSEHERSELAQLEAAIHKFITDYGAA